MVRVAYQGAPGAYSEEAVRALWPDAEPLPLRENADVARAVATGDAEGGVLPVENTLAGSVLASYDALLAFPGLWVTGELRLPIRHCLLAPPGATLASIRRVESHPVALAQCTEFFHQHPYMEVHASYDTAGAAAEVAASRDPWRAALASRLAAERYGLIVLRDDLADRPDNTTRFLSITRTPAEPAAGEPAHTMLALTLANEPGALLRVLAPLASAGINLTRIESRPTGEPWTYRFIIEMEHAAGAPVVRTVIDEVRRVALSCRIVGSWASRAR